MAVGLRHFIHPKCLGVVWFVLSVTPEVCIPSYANCVRLHIEHDHPIFCARLIKKVRVLNLVIIMSTPPLECIHCVVCVLFVIQKYVIPFIMIVPTLKTQIQGRDWSWFSKSLRIPRF